MPKLCSVFYCANRRGIESRSRGITFHKFPKDKDDRKKWEMAVKKDRFTANESSRICSEHFQPHDFDRTGRVVRLRGGVIPSIFSFPVHFQRPKRSRTTSTTTSTSRKAEVSLSVVPKDDPGAAASHSQPQPHDDHSYALPASPTALKARLNKVLTRVQSLEREKKYAMAREKRAKTSLKSLLGDLREKNLINKELRERLDFYSDLQVGFPQGHEYTKTCREFALTL